MTMEIHESAENYLETIYILSKEKPDVHSIDIANELEFSKPSVSIAMKRLRENGYIEMNEDAHITLTEKGQEIANSMYERHLILSQWLISLGVNDNVAVDDACRIEHIISKESFDAIKAHVGQLTINN